MTSLRAGSPFDLVYFLYLATSVGRAGPQGSVSQLHCHDARGGNHLLRRTYWAWARRSCGSLLAPSKGRGSGPWLHFTEDKRRVRGSQQPTPGEVALSGRAGLVPQICLAPEPMFQSLYCPPRDFASISFSGPHILTLQE